MSSSCSQNLTVVGQGEMAPLVEEARRLNDEQEVMEEFGELGFEPREFKPTSPGSTASDATDDIPVSRNYTTEDVFGEGFDQEEEQEFSNASQASQNETKQNGRVPRVSVTTPSTRNSRVENLSHVQHPSLTLQNINDLIQVVKDVINTPPPIPAPVNVTINMPEMAAMMQQMQTLIGMVQQQQERLNQQEDKLKQLAEHL